MELTQAQQASTGMVLGLAAAIKANALRIDQVSSPHLREAVREHLVREGYGGSAKARNLVMQWQREDKERAQQRMRDLVAAGFTPYSPKQEVFTTVLRVHLDGCESGEYPTATKTAQAVVSDKATKLLAKTNKKRLREAFRENKEHPGMQRIEAIISNSTITAAASGTVSTCLGALVDAHKLARLIGEQQQRTVALEARLATAEKEAARANTRLDLKDSGHDWKEAARAVLAAEPGISNRELARRVGRDEKSIRKYLKDIKGGVAD